MAAAEVRIARSAEPEFRGLGRDAQRSSVATIALLQRAPGRPRPGLDLHRLKGLKGKWRRRVGEYRGIYQREGATIIFHSFAQRSSVY